MGSGKQRPEDVLGLPGRSRNSPRKRPIVVYPSKLDGCSEYRPHRCKGQIDSGAWLTGLRHRPDAVGDLAQGLGLRLTLRDFDHLPAESLELRLHTFVAQPVTLKLWKPEGETGFRKPREPAFRNPGGVAALYLGKREEKNLTYVGKVGTGFRRVVSAGLRKKLDALATPKTKLSGRVNKPKATWVIRCSSPRSNTGTSRQKGICGTRASRDW
jgi:ATP dependent DNA ligase C terminal region